MKEWLYFLTDESGRSYYVENGVVKTSASRKALRATPDGWQDIALAWERNTAKIGPIRNFSLPLGFVLDGAAILRHIMYERSVEEKVYLVITRHKLLLTATHYDDKYYEYFYKGELDLSTIIDDDQKVTVNIMEGGLSKLLKANEATVYEFDLDDPRAITVKQDGLNLYEKHNYLILEGSYSLTHFLNVTPTTSEGQANGFATTAVMGANTPGGYDYTTGSDYLFAVSQDIPGMRITGRITFRAASSNPWSAYLHTSTGRNILVASVLTPTLGQTYTVDFDVTFDGFDGEKFFFLGDSPDFFTNANYLETSFSIEFKSRYRTTYTKAFKLSDLYELLIEKVTGSALNADSSWIEQFDRYVVTSGDGIRSLAGAKVKTSLNQFYDAVRTILCAGQGIENGKVILHEASHFLDPSNPIHLGKAKSLKVTRAREEMANTFKIGYDAKEIDDVNGKYEFNNTHIYTSPHTRTVREFDLICPYNAQPYLIEITRINLEGKTTTDNKADNQNFLLDVEAQSFSGIAITATSDSGVNYLRFTDADQYLDYFGAGGRFTITGANINNGAYTVLWAISPPFSDDILVAVEEGVIAGAVTGATVEGAYKLHRPALTITGVPDPDTIFNIELSPKRITNAWLEYIFSMFYKMDGEKIKLASIDRNPDLVTEGIETIEEKADITITSRRLFLPFFFEFDTEVPVDLVSILESTPNRCFSFEWMGSTFSGFLMKAGIAPNTNKEQAFKLLAAPGNDLTNLL